MDEELTFLPVFGSAAEFLSGLICLWLKGFWQHIVQDIFNYPVSDQFIFKIAVVTNLSYFCADLVQNCQYSPVFFFWNSFVELFSFNHSVLWSANISFYGLFSLHEEMSFCPLGLWCRVFSELYPIAYSLKLWHRFCWYIRVPLMLFLNSRWGWQWTFSSPSTPLLVSLSWNEVLVYDKVQI